MPLLRLQGEEAEKPVQACHAAIMPKQKHPGQDEFSPGLGPRGEAFLTGAIGAPFHLARILTEKLSISALTKVQFVTVLKGHYPFRVNALSIMKCDYCAA